MDQSFGALDIKTRLNMQNLLTELWHKFRSTIIFVTHDIYEAVYLAGGIYILKSQPARFVEHSHIDLAQERNRLTKRNPNYVSLVHLVEDKMVEVSEMK
jgi:NitT/TauT family transport system ATP-binding protein